MKPGRNDPCPCGSGKKYKHCHGAAFSIGTSAAPVSSRESAIAVAASELHAGRLDTAAVRLDGVLRAAPDHPDALLLRAGVAHRQQDYRRSVALLTSLIHRRPNFADAYFNLALSFGAQGQTADAEARYRDTLRLRPDFTDAWTNLGNLLRGAGRFEEAEACHRSAVDRAPDSPRVRLNLASTLKSMGRLSDAEAECREALGRDPDLPEAHNNLGNVLVALGRLDEATREFEEALRGRPEDPDVECNLALALKLAGRVGDAIGHARNAFQRRADRRSASMLADCLKVARFEVATPDLEADLAAFLEVPSTDPSDLVPAIASALRGNAGLAPLLRATAEPSCELHVGGEILAAAVVALGNPLLLRLMSLTVVFDPHFEQGFTRARAALLFNPALRRRVPPAFLTALAHQCFLVEYVYAESEAEAETVAVLSREIARTLESGQALAPEPVAVLACYRQLGGESFAAQLQGRPELAPIDTVITRQVIEPMEEQRIAATLPVLSKVEDAVSRRVQAQYEEHPYPRWRKAGLPEPIPFARAIRELFPSAAIGPALDTVSPRILVAGCGTGKHAILTGLRYEGSRVTAVDLSGASLAYGVRQAHALDVRNIEFLQGDILDLGGIEPGFDLVESFGVLHHMRDPIAGWRLLANLLKPGGLMMIGLYSEIARKPVVEARRLITERGYPATLAGIRRFRGDLRHSDSTLRTALEQSVDFYSASGCRDLLFHIEEHRFTLPQIETSVLALGLEFVGFELHDATVLTGYRARFPEDATARSLANWDTFEREQPDTFSEAYKFWLRKPGRATPESHKD